MVHTTYLGILVFKNFIIMLFCTWEVLKMASGLKNVQDRRHQGHLFLARCTGKLLNWAKLGKSGELTW